MFERSRKGEHALLVQPHRGSRLEEDVLEEFVELARSAGAEVVATANARIDRPNAATLIGTGKLEELKAIVEASGADLVLVNHSLTPVQERNLERALERRVIDRTGLILDIFAQRAQSHEGKLQVELAQLKHLATRLVRGWTHLERQRGGSIGLRGPGETQLETDRRLLQTRLEQLQRKLEKVEVQRTQMRRARTRSELPRVALVGYTNAGKSTLFNALTGAEAYAADQLFATLDPTVRRIEISGGHALLADTVGFVRDLPHDLVAAFRSTLSEAREADLLLHVIDAADPHRDDRIAQVDAVLAEIGAGDLPQILVFNKIDRIDGAEARRDVPTDDRPRVWLSARDGIGLEHLRDALGDVFALRRVIGELHLPADAGRLRARLHALDAIQSETHDDAGWHVAIDLPETDVLRLLAAGDAEPLRLLLPEPEPDPI
ncbi:ribosome rescue GTPase HflX [Solilutibacter silvestris]|uniref:GTPase HflX n=1 Tax=Solilutibacter silvestris TaxID=1645665 RepID=A0A2K1Q3S7_9GAMM|nr:ribosome rescue GTPase HflX [Lysobacter silvestris]PNS09689.1 GTP-binding protein HflX [Lysobacter silvestris]